MINITSKTKGAVNRDTILSVNTSNIQGIKTAQNIESLNKGSTCTAPNPSASTPPASTNHNQANPINQSRTTSIQANALPPQQATHPVLQQTTQQAPQPVQQQAPQPIPQQAPQPVQQQAPAQQAIPVLQNPVQKGQKVVIEPSAPLAKLKAAFGWNTTNAQCDVDVSAFMLGADGKVLGDSWFVFYGQPQSPDLSTEFIMDHGSDREIVNIDFTKLNQNVKKIVFVLTINDALEKNLHFGMMKDAYIRLLNPGNGSELVSFKMTEYYSNVISMMIGEVYNHNGVWKFNAVGNGVARDLAGLCELYGVEVID